jgi:membrane-bound serine protease (ClpP class)
MIPLLSQATTAQSSSLILWAFIFIAVAVIIFFIEIFLPSGGLLALLGGLAIIASLIAFFMHDINTGLIATGIYIVFGPIIAWIVFKIWASSSLAKRMVLGDVDGGGEFAKQESEAQRRERLDELHELIGAKGETITVLRPVGVVRIENQRYDAMAESGVISANKPVKVVDVYDNQIKVREVIA